MGSAGYILDSDERAQSPPPVKAVFYPGERWRFWLAAIASAASLLLCLYVLGHRATLIVSLLLAAGSVWCSLQIWRARLLGNSVKVTPGSFPALQGLLDEVRGQLGYEGRIDVYVAEKSDPSVKLTTYLGTRILLIEGGLVAELLDPRKQSQLRFLIARHVGALKARQYRLDPLLVMLNAANALQFVKPFLLPYYRSIAYSGDQIGLACCGSVEAALEATARLLVGKELADELPLGGVLPQAALVKQRLLPRFAQFLSPTPHVINRYLNLLTFGRLDDPEAWDRLAASLSATEKVELDRLWMSSPHRRRATQLGLAFERLPVAREAPTF